MKSIMVMISKKSSSMPPKVAWVIGVISFFVEKRNDTNNPPGAAPQGKPGRQPKWGKRLEPPRRGGMWKAKWQVGTAFVYGRQRTIRWKEIICLWRVLGWEVPVKVIVAAVEGYKERFTLVTSAVELTGCRWWSCSRRGSGRRTGSAT